MIDARVFFEYDENMKAFFVEVTTKNMTEQERDDSYNYCNTKEEAKEFIVQKINELI